MKVRSISKNEIHEFCKLGHNEEEGLLFKNALQEAWEDNRSFPHWCFVLEDDEKFVAGVAFDVLQSEPLNLMLWRLYIPSGEDFLDIGIRLLRGAVENLKYEELNLIEYHLYGCDDKIFDDKKAVFLGVGFEIKQRKKNYRLKDGNIGQWSGRLILKTLSEVGQEKFVEAIRTVTEGTLDSYDELDVMKLGRDMAARNCFDSLKDIHCNEDWWKLAYEPNGDFAGLIIPQKFSSKLGVINYIGVTPEKRGKGYVRDLLIVGTEILKADGIEEIIADIDVNNTPMENALISVGYKFNKNELVLEKEFQK